MDKVSNEMLGRSQSGNEGEGSGQGIITDFVEHCKIFFTLSEMGSNLADLEQRHAIFYIVKKKNQLLCHKSIVGGRVRRRQWGEQADQPVGY